MLRALVGAMLLVLTFAGGFAVAAHKTVTLTVDGASMTVPTMKSRVIDVIKENGFEVGERDDLYPAANESVHQSDTIVLRRSRPLQISTDGENSRQVWTTASTVAEALAQLQMTDKAPAAASRGSRVPLAGHVTARRERQDRATQRRRRGPHIASRRAERRCAVGGRRGAPGAARRRGARRVLARRATGCGFRSPGSESRR